MDVFHLVTQVNKSFCLCYSFDTKRDKVMFVSTYVIKWHSILIKNSLLIHPEFSFRFLSILILYMVRVIRRNFTNDSALTYDYSEDTFTFCRCVLSADCLSKIMS